MSQGGFSLMRVSAVVGVIAAGAYYCPPKPLQILQEKFPNLTLYVLAFFLLKDYALPTIATFCYTGPPMNSRRKTMIATWQPAGYTGEIYSEISFDMTNANKFIEEQRKKGIKVTITHMVIKAVGNALKAVPSVNGRVVFGRYIPYDTCDVSCLVNIDDGKDLAMCRIANADATSLEDIGAVLRKQADKLRAGKDEDFKKSKGPINALSTGIISWLLPFVGFLSGGLGLTIPALGVKRFLFGGAVVTSVGMMGLDNCYVPHTPWARAPIFVMVGAMKDKPTVEDGKVVVRPMLSITATLDHRFLDGAQGAHLADELRKSLGDPATYLERHNAVQAN